VTIEIDKTKLLQILAVVLALIVAGALVVLPGGESPAKRPTNSRPVLVCIDSTESTDDVRDEYLADLEKVVRQAAFHQDDFRAAACGANATGEVNWSVSRYFRALSSKEQTARQELEYQAGVVIEGNEEKRGIVELLDVESRETTPIGEMLAVTARQCDGEGCQIYFFTDGEWADDLLHIKDGVSDGERRLYLSTYDSEKLNELDGSTVNFYGVGLKTEIGELRLNEAKSIAEELVEEGGGKMGDWRARL
jgi:hypothetical protein